MAEPRAFRGPRHGSLLAVPHRHERLPRHAVGQAAARPSHGPGAGAVAGGADRGDPARGDVDRAGARWPGALRRRPGRRGRVARDDPACLGGRAAAPPAAPARRAHPLRGAALEGQRGRRAAGDERRGRQQRAPARAGDDRQDRCRRRRGQAVDPGGPGAALALRRRVPAL